MGNEEKKYPCDRIPVHLEEIEALEPTFYNPDFNKVRLLLKQAIRLSATADNVAKCKYIPSRLRSIPSLILKLRSIANEVNFTFQELNKMKRQAALRFTDLLPVGDSDGEKDMPSLPLDEAEEQSQPEQNQASSDSM